MDVDAAKYYEALSTAVSELEDAISRMPDPLGYINKLITSINNQPRLGTDYFAITRERGLNALDPSLFDYARTRPTQETMDYLVWFLNLYATEATCAWLITGLRAATSRKFEIRLAFTDLIDFVIEGKHIPEQLRNSIDEESTHYYANQLQHTAGARNFENVLSVKVVQVDHTDGPIN